MKTYTEAEIKAAFWRTFHESGELWFCYFGTAEENAQDTEPIWQEMLEYMNEKKGGKP